MNNRNLIIKNLNTTGLYVLIIGLFINMMLNFNFINVFLLMLITVRYVNLYALNNHFNLKKNYYLTKKESFTYNFMEHLLQLNIELNVTNALMLHKWKETDFIEDKITLFEINYFYHGKE